VDIGASLRTVDRADRCRSGTVEIRC